MRKTVVLCIVILLLAAMVGCGGGPAGDEFRLITEQTPMSIEEIWKIEEEYDFVCEMSMYIGEKCDYGSNLEVLSEPERVFYIAQTLEMEVNNGGFWQFFFNTPADIFCETADAFEAIGAEQTAALYREAVAALGEDMPDDRSSRIRMLGKLGMEEGYEILAPYDDAFYSYAEDLAALNYAYIQKNRDAFS